MKECKPILRRDNQYSKANKSWEIYIGIRSVKTLQCFSPPLPIIVAEVGYGKAEIDLKVMDVTLSFMMI